jgi:hypothetical protein
MATPQPSTDAIVPMPLNDYPFVETNRQLTFVWYQFLRGLWQRVGGNIAQLISGTVDSINHTLRMLVNNTSFVALGVTAAAGQDAEVQTPLKGAAAITQVLGASPFTFLAPFQGTLLVESGQVALQRDGMVAAIVCGLQGGAIPVLKGDTVIVTWYNSAPQVVFLPGGSYP